MTRKIVGLATLVAAVALTACGAGEDSGKAAAQAAGAKATVEQAAHVTLTAETVPAVEQAVKAL
jgi:hypothetical protein